MAHRIRHCLVYFEPDRLAEPSAPQLCLQGQHQVVGLVLLQFQVRVARHPEEVSLQDRHAGEEHIQVGGDDLFKQNEPARPDLQEARQNLRHLDPGEPLLLVVRVFHADRQRQAEGAYVWEGMARIHRQGRQDRVDLVGEASRSASWCSGTSA